MSLPSAIKFYFDFSSPYAYLLARDLTHTCQRAGRELDWHPFLLGVVFQQSGRKPPLDSSPRGLYLQHEVQRTARRKGLKFQLPKHFPFNSVLALRVYWQVHAISPRRARHLAAALLDATFLDGLDIREPSVLGPLLERFGLDAEALLAHAGAPEVKALAKTKVDEALSAGVAGSPWVVIDGEPFWGNDRLDDIQHWLETGGF